MPKLKLLGASGRFGVRYGKLVKRRITEIEAIQRKKQKCTFCSGRAKRISKGIWQCNKCGKKFAGHAYYLEAPYLGNSTQSNIQNNNEEIKKAKVLKENFSIKKEIEEKKETIKKTKSKSNKNKN